MVTVRAHGIGSRPAIRKLLLAAFLAVQLGAARGSWPADIDITPGDIFVADEFVGLIHIDVETGEHALIPKGRDFDEQKGMVVDADGRHLIFRSGNSLVRFDPITEVTSILSSGGYLGDYNGRISLGPSGEILFTSDRYVAPGNIDGTIVQVDRDTGEQVPLYTGGLLAGLGEVAFDSNSDLYVESASSVVRIDAETGTQSFFLYSPNGLTHYGRLAVLPDDRLAVFRYQNYEHPRYSVLTVDSSGAIDSVVAVPYYATDLDSTKEGHVYYSGCFGVDEYCAEGVVQRLAPDPADLYWGDAPLAFDVVPLPEPVALGQLILGVAAIGCLSEARRRKRTSRRLNRRDR